MTEVRYEYNDFPDDAIPEGWVLTGDAGADDGHVECQREIPSTGYCGLAGFPR
jgi:hypothetical protein